MSKHQLITLWITGIVISIIALITAVSWQHIKYPFHFFITASLPALIIGSLLYYTIGKVEHPLRWFHRGWRRKILLIILILLSATLLALVVVSVIEDVGTVRSQRQRKGLRSFLMRLERHQGSLESHLTTQNHDKSKNND